MGARAIAKRIPGLAPLARTAFAASRDAWVALSERTQDRWFGIATYVPGVNEPPEAEDDVGYQPFKYVAYRRLLRKFPLRGDDVFYDVGCGKGRVSCLVARRPIRKSIGIEYLPRLVADANANAAVVRGRIAPIEIRAGDATLVDYSEGTVYFFFNPFGARTMRAVLERIRESLVVAPRPVRLIYFNPVHEHLWAESEWLQKTDSFSVNYYFRSPTRPVTLWENTKWRAPES